MKSSTGYGCFDLKYEGLGIEYWLDRHPGLHEGANVRASNLWAEFRACYAMGLDPDDYFAKDRFMRAFITGGHIAARSIQAMAEFDTRPKDNKR